MVYYEPMIIGLLTLLILGFCVLTYVVWKLQTHYNRLVRGSHEASLGQVLDTILSDVQAIKKRVERLEGESGRLLSDGMTHIQRIGVVRFNPFSDTGGAQSFTMAILDAHHNGIVMTSLYGRNGNRWYVKRIAGGLGKDIELSKEELSAIKQAIANI